MNPFESDDDRHQREARDRRRTVDRAAHCQLSARLIHYELQASPLNLDPETQLTLRTALRLVITDALAIGVDLGITDILPKR